MHSPSSPPPEAGRRSAAGRTRDLDVVCGAAILFVFVQHLPVALRGAAVSDQGPSLAYFSFWSGVDLLLAVAGFLAARELAQSLAAAKGLGGKMQAAWRFWLRCAWRVLPSAWLWLAVAVLCTVAFNRSGAFGTRAAAFDGAVASVLNIENLRIAFFAPGAEHGAAFPYWALSLATQFCLILPVVFALGRSRVWVLLVAAILFQLILPRGLGGPTSFVRADALLLGTLIAILAKEPVYLLFKPVGLAGSRPGQFLVPGFLLSLLAASSGSGLRQLPFAPGVVAVLAAALVWVASYDGGFILPDGSVGRRVLGWIGTRALPLYFGHMPAFLATREIWFRLDPASLSAQPPHQLRFLATALILLAVLAELSHRLIEAPFRRAAPSRRRTFGEATPAHLAPAELVQAGPSHDD